MLFIIQHQCPELWMKLMLHELKAAIGFVRVDQLDACFKILSRVKLIQKQLFEQWSVLETLTPSEYEGFRSSLGSSSGFQSRNIAPSSFCSATSIVHCSMSFMLRSRGPRRAHRAARSAIACTTNSAPSVATRLGGARPPASNATGRSRTSAAPSWCRCSSSSMTSRRSTGTPYEMAEKLVDVEESFQLWRFRHLKTVERIIGHKPGTGGSSGEFPEERAGAHFFSRAHRRTHRDRHPMNANVENSGPDRACHRRARPGQPDRRRHTAARRAAFLRACSAPTATALTSANHSLGRPLDATADDLAQAIGLWQSKLGDAWDELVGRDRRLPRAPRATARRSARGLCRAENERGQGLRAILNTYDGVPRVVATRGEFDSIDLILRQYARAAALRSTSSKRAIRACSTPPICWRRWAGGSGRHLAGLVPYRPGAAGASGAGCRGARWQARVLIDVYHSLGVFPVDVVALDADFAIGAAYSISRGGPGAGYLYLHPRHLDGSLSTLDVGWFAKRIISHTSGRTRRNSVWAATRFSNRHRR